jgi:diguanylate cyclase (GGDEF)-like protein
VTLAAALVYWVIVALWLTVLGAIVYFYVRNPHAFGTTRLLLAVLAIDTCRNIFENIYFGLYFGSTYKLLAPEIADVLGTPILLILPKLLNIAAGCVVLGVLLLRWLPLAVKERRVADEHASDLEMLAAMDWLTGLYNRRHFETLARSELARCQRYLRPLSLLTIDIDHFKSVNDQFGHAAGDRVLRLVANACYAAKRDSDMAARIGGEEFALLLPETSEDAAAQFAERLRDQIRGCTPNVEGTTLTVTVSIGIASANAATTSIDVLMREADQALYDAKRSGRDRVVVWGCRHEVPQTEAAE